MKKILLTLCYIALAAAAPLAAGATVTYHVITLPFENDGNTYRIEALTCTSDAATIGLPADFQSPLATNYKYWSATTVSGKAAGATPFAPNTNITRDNYNGIAFSGDGDYTAGAAVGEATDIYVTYDYVGANATADLTGSISYNITMACANGRHSNASLKSHMLEQNMSRDDTGDGTGTGKRPGTLDCYYFNVGGGTFVSTTGSWISGVKYMFVWTLNGSDPYNIRLMTPSGEELYGQMNTGMYVTKRTDSYYTGITSGFYNAFALLYASGSSLGLMATGIAPNGSGNYAWLTHDDNATHTSNNPQAQYRPRGTGHTDSDIITLWTIFDIRLHALSSTGSDVSTSLGQWSDFAYTNYSGWDNGFANNYSPTNLPAAIKRAYCTYDATSFYTDQALTQTLTENKYRAAIAAEKAKGAGATDDGCVDIYLKYTYDLPFEAGKVGDTYDDLHWYNLYINNETQYTLNFDYIHYPSGAAPDESKGKGYVTNKNASRYPYNSHFAFVGDPYDLRIVNRQHCFNNSKNISYVGYTPGCDSKTPLDSLITASATVQTARNDGYSWEIMTESTSSLFRLRSFGTAENKPYPTYFTWMYGNNTYNKWPVNMTYQNEYAACKIWFMEVPDVTYTYHVIDQAGNEALKCTATQYVGTPLNYANLPEVIKSPMATTLTFKTYQLEGDDHQKVITETNNDSNFPFRNNIYVYYTPTEYHASYTVRLNGEYIYYDEDEDEDDIKSVADISGNPGDNYKWTLEGFDSNLDDPYAMTIKNVGNNKYVKVTTWGDNTALEWVNDKAEASKFVIKSSGVAHVFEVMAATGATVDASYTYYNIGRPEANTVKIYSNATYPHGYGQLRFQLTPASVTETYTYHLIDKAGKDLLQVDSRSDKLHFPDDYWSPLVDEYHYYAYADFTVTDGVYRLSGSPTELTSPSGATDTGTDGKKDIFVTYDTGTRVDLTANTMYLLKFATGTDFRAENGADDLEASPVKPVYPYCNGDNKFFVYGQEQYEAQQKGASTTRTRWAWYVESDNNDPYHVRIMSRQTVVYPDGSGINRHAYFRTYQPADYNEVVTNLTWPGIMGEEATEYMVLGTTGMYKLLTTETVPLDLNHDGDTEDTGESDMRRTLNSFEQYWKTYDTARRKVLNQPNVNPYKQNLNDPNTVPATPFVVANNNYRQVGDADYSTFTSNRIYLEEAVGWHHYVDWAYAKRWNGYNSEGKASKGWEQIEHWFETVKMGEGYFDFVPTSIDPALVLLDQHGWEIMRKPLPNSPTDPQKDAKYAAIRPFDSPMVQAYYFYSKASKRSGFHQYYNLGNQVSDAGEVYTSTSLTDLPPYNTATNIKDASGNLIDLYVTYTVKDEYLGSYDPESHEGAPFLIQQGSKVGYSNSPATTVGAETLGTGGMSQYIIDNIGNLTTTGTLASRLWYLMPNADIDKEMGYDDSSGSESNHDWTNDYTVTHFSNEFDPYNIQISSCKEAAKYFVSNATGAHLSEGVMAGTYSADAAVTLGAQSTTATGSGHDNSTVKMTNATFMAVQDEDGNMQLMPRFDHTLRLRNFSTLVTPDAEAEDPDKLTETYTQLFHPLLYHYFIMDNQGREALRYRSGGDLVPHVPEHLQSPLAKDFTFYKTMTFDDGNMIHTSLVAAGLYNDTGAPNNVYVRYSYDPEADNDHVLQGNWLTMQLNAKDAIANGGMKQGADRPSPMDAGAEARKWQWKLLATPQTAPDPYAVSLYNRSVGGAGTTVNGQTRFALLPHTEGGYAMAVDGLGTFTYHFVNGNAMSTTTAATTAVETGFHSASATFDGTKAQVLLTDDVVHTFEYQVRTNGNVEAVSATQSNDQLRDNGFVPETPYTIQTPLLNMDQYIYYDHPTDTVGKALSALYGLYDDVVYVRYSAYDPDVTEYEVPNERVWPSGGATVQRAETSNDAPIDLNRELLYNFIWYNDNMMYSSDNTTIADAGSKDISSGEYEWTLEGNDPYAIEIVHKTSEKKLYSSDDATCALNESATPFMLLKKTGYDYGVLQKTGGDKRLTGYGNELTNGDPTQFVIFALSTLKVYYHLIIKNIGDTVHIPYRATKGGEETTLAVPGTTKRDLTTTSTVTGDTYQLGETINGQTYSVYGHHVSLGDKLDVPAEFQRPNCKYLFYVEGVYTDNDCERSSHLATELDGQYRGLNITKMPKDAGLIGKTVRVNIVYQFDDGVPTNTGSKFVENATGTEWYTFETSDHVPYLAHYTFSDGKLTTREGRDTHYTNDFLWSPVGDPYGFVMYNRYVYKNGGRTDYVMTTTANPAADADLIMSDDTSDKRIYELFAGSSDGYFKVSPLMNSGVFLDNTHASGEHSGAVSLKTSTSTEWHFGLAEEQLKPFYDYAGDIGGLTVEAEEGEKTGKQKYEEADDLMAKRDIVYNDGNIIQFSAGFYRVYSQEGSSGITTPRYLSGYTHEIEKTVVSGGLPLHFYEMAGVSTSFSELGSGFTVSNATHGDIPIPAAEYDPASIFYFEAQTPVYGFTPYKMSTQGLYVKGAKLTATAGDATMLYVSDIGGGVMVIHNGAFTNDLRDRTYLNYDQASNIYDVQYDASIGIADHTKWRVEPLSRRKLRIATHSGGDGYYYGSFYAAFGATLQNDAQDTAYVIPAWTTPYVRPKSIDQDIPANTPVLIRTKQTTGYVEAMPDNDITAITGTNVLAGTCFEQQLDATGTYYVFGAPIGFGTDPGTLNTSTGAFDSGNGTLPSPRNTDPAFYVNVNFNREGHASRASWERNNHYVYANKVYYREADGGGGGGSARSFTPDCIPVDWSLGIDDDDDELLPDGSRTARTADDAVYDLRGRRVASPQQVADGSWRYRLQPGIYIHQGRKIVKK